MREMNFGIIGAGGIAKKAFIPALFKTKNTNLVGVLNSNKSSTIQAARLYDCVAFNSVDEMLSDKNINSIYIASPPNFHEKYCVLSARYKKHILCEKPLSTSFVSVKNIINECQKQDVSLFEGFMYQYHPQHARVKEIIKKRKLGKPILFEAKFGFPPLDDNNFRYKKSMGGGSILDAGVYTIHSARKFFEKEPVNVCSINVEKNKDIDLHGSLILDFGDNKSAHLAFGFQNYYKNTYSIWLENGYITLERAYSLPDNLKTKIFFETNNCQETLLLEKCDQFKLQIETFQSSFNDKEKREYYYKDAYNQAKIIEKIRTNYAL